MLMQISYPNIFWNNVSKFQENRESSFWYMHKSMCLIVVGEYQYRGGGQKLDRYPFRKTRKSQEQYTY